MSKARSGPILSRKPASNPYGTRIDYQTNVGPYGLIKYGVLCKKFRIKSKARSGRTSFRKSVSKPTQGDRQGIDYQINIGPYGWIKYDEPFTRFMMPLIRRVWPKLISSNLVSVQPMGTRPVVRIRTYDPEDYPQYKEKEEFSGPACSIFYHRYRYGKGNSVVTAKK